MAESITAVIIWKHSADFSGKHEIRSSMESVCCWPYNTWSAGNGVAVYCISDSPCLPDTVKMGHSSWLMWVSVLVTIRQCAESLSVRVGADHFLVSHHPGCSVVHLGDGGADGQRKRHNTAQETKEHRLKHGWNTLWFCLCFVSVLSCLTYLLFSDDNVDLCTSW